MAGLPWVRLDTGFPTNPKILGLIADRNYQAVCGYVCALAWSGGQGTDGFLPELALFHVHLTQKTAASLVESGLFHPVLGGYQINDWTEYQQTTAETAERSAKAQAAARIRWDRVREEEARHAARLDASSIARRNATASRNGNAPRDAEQNRTEQST
jgi:hypothetical protein